MTATASTVSPPGFAAGIWPCTTRLDPGGGIRVGGWSLGELARRHGTPPTSWTRPMSASGAASTARRCPGRRSPTRGRPSSAAPWPTGSARKAWPWTPAQQGELAVAQAVGFPAGRVLLHGNAKTPDDLRGRHRLRGGPDRARLGRGDHRLAAFAPGRQRVLRPRRARRRRAHPRRGGDRRRRPEVRLRAQLRRGRGRRTPGPGQPELGSPACTATSARRSPRPEAFELAARQLIALMAAVRAEHGVALPELNLGGGHAVPYTDGDQDFDLGGFADRIRARGPRRLCLAAPAGAAAHRRAGPRDHQPGHGHAVPGGRRQADWPAGARSSPSTAG